MQMLKRQYSREFKLELCRKISSKESSRSALLREHGLSSGTVGRWMDQYLAKGEDAFTGQDWRPESLSGPDASDAQLRQEISMLKAELDRAQRETDFMREALGKLGGHRGKGQR